MNAFHINSLAHAKLKSAVGSALPWVKSSHRAEAIARGFGFGSNAAFLEALRPSATCVVHTCVMHPSRFAQYLLGKGWTVDASIFVASCFLMRTPDLDNLYVPRWGTALVDGQWIGLVLWDSNLASAGVTVPRGEHGPTWLSGIDLTGVPLSRFRGDVGQLPRRFDGNARAALGPPRPPGEFRDLGPYLGGERFPYNVDEVPIYEMFGARNLPYARDEAARQDKKAREAGHYASVVCL